MCTHRRTLRHVYIHTYTLAGQKVIVWVECWWILEPRQQQGKMLLINQRTLWLLQRCHPVPSLKFSVNAGWRMTITRPWVVTGAFILSFNTSFLLLSLLSSHSLELHYSFLRVMQCVNRISVILIPKYFENKYDLPVCPYIWAVYTEMFVCLGKRNKSHL